MPLLAVLLVLVQIGFAVHVVRTGRATTWLFIIMFLPAIGCAAYFLAEILPELRRSRAARQVAAELGHRLDPDRDYRRLSEAVADLPTADNKRALAEALVRRERYDEAQALYESALAPPHDGDPAILMGLARCRLLMGDAAGAVEALDRLQAASPDFHSHDGHLLYARSLEAAGRAEEALAEYAALAPLYPGEEARCRYALLLQARGEAARAREIFQAVARSADKAGRRYAREQQAWVEMARANLGA